MPHCGGCGRFYPTTWPNGCIHCNQKRYPGPFCESCQTVWVATNTNDGRPIVEFDMTTGEALRPNCPDCRTGPMVPSYSEIMRREQGMTLPFRPTGKIQRLLKETIPIPPGEVELVEVRLFREPPEGTKLYVRSAMIEQYMAAMSKNTELEGGLVLCKGRPNTVFAGLIGYDGPTIPNATKNIPCSAWRYCTDKTAILEDGDRVDLGFLRAVGLSKGVTFTLPTAHSPEAIIDYSKSLATKIRAFYVNVAMPVDSRIQITTRVVTR